MSARAFDLWLTTLPAALLETTLIAGLLWLLVSALGPQRAALRVALCRLALLRFAIPPQLGFPLLGAASIDVPTVAGPVSSAAGLALLHLAGAAALVACLLVQQARLWRIRRLATEIRGGGARVLLDRLAPATGPRLRLLLSADVRRPFVCGLFRPTVILPMTAVRELSHDQLALVLRHEVAHVRKGDLVFNAALMALAPLWWFNPLFWLIARALQRAQEDRCDDVVVSEAGVPAVTYGQMLVKSARLTRRPVLVDACPSLVGAGLIGRVRRLVDSNVTPSPRLSRPALAGLLLVGALVLPGWSAARSSSSSPTGAVATGRQPVAGDAEGDRTVFLFMHHGEGHAKRHRRRHGSTRPSR